ncbi:MAG: TMEM43 family protein [Synechococcus sp.]|nr:TMEM43 family protein [Synechococcus sp.]
MSEQYTEQQRVGYFQRLANSIVGIFLGIALFFASFGVLYWNEGRVDLSKVAATATEIPATGTPTVNAGSFVSLTGTLTSPETLGDRPYLEPGEYIALRRKAEMYAWEENSRTTTTKNVGGSETKTTTYTYEKEWTENPENSATFKQAAGHQNPAKSIESADFRVSQAQVGDYQLDLNQLKFPVSQSVNLTAAQIPPASKSNLSGSYLFFGTGNLTSPQIGDMRLSYQALNENIQATVFGSLGGGNQLTPYKAPRNISFYRLFPGARDQAIATLATQHKLLTWGLRAGGFLMMWIGLNLVVEPLGVLLDVIPFFGDLLRTATGFATFILAVLLSGVTIVISMILHSPIMIFLALGLCGFIFYRWTKRKKTKDSLA